jgi:serine protease Do
MTGTTGGRWRMATADRRSFLAFLLGIAALASFTARSLAGDPAAISTPTALSDDEAALVRAAEQVRISAIDKVYGAVVAIYGNDRGGGGSGVLFDPAGYAVTNHHVVAAAGVEGWAGLADGKLYRWKLIGTDPGGDVAVIQLRGKDEFPTAKLGDSDTVRVGDWSMAMGNPFTLAEDQRPTVTLGIVSGVNRYQPGQGMNQLVYGNCIQVDSSINPGNSGGPLFNLRGEIIGINGRGSFQERGRVNVGLGYAISSNQVKRFLPELLATKIAQHGTLDALFGNRIGGVICHTVNLDSPAAQAGLQLGDRLVEFEGQPISNANEFTNLITTYPAGWPVTLVVERSAGESDDVVRQTITVRLTPLPYEPRVKPGSPEEKPEEKDAEPKDEKDGEAPMPSKPEEGGKPDLPPKPVEVRIPSMPLADAGTIRDREVNGLIAREILERLRRDFGPWLGEDAKRPIRVVSERMDPAAAGSASCEYVIAPDGRILLVEMLDGRTVRTGFDGKRYWQHDGDAAREISAAKASRNPRFLQAMIAVALASSKTPAGFGPWQLDGADKAAKRLAYRLSAKDEQGEEVFVWIIAENDDESAALRPLKAAVGIDDDEPVPAVVFDEVQKLSDMLSARHPLVRGLAESRIGRADNASFNDRRADEAEVDESVFQMPETRQPE